MSNALGSLAGNLIAQRSLEILALEFPVLGLVASDFSDEKANYGQSIITRTTVPGTAADFSATDGFVATDTASTDVTVTLNKFKHATFEINPTEFNASNRNLVEEYAKASAISLGTAIYSDICSLFVAANYSNTATTCALADATRKTIIVAANTALNKRKVQKDRFAIYNSDLYGKLMEDDSLVNTMWGAQGIQEGKLPVVHGVTLIDNPSLITTANLIGVQGAKDSVVFASRVPSDPTTLAPDLPKIANVFNVVHPQLGLTVQVRMFENPVKGSITYSLSLIYGVAKGNIASLQLIKSA